MTTGVLAIVVLCFTLSFPESPRWLALKGRYEEAREVIALVDDVEPDSEPTTFILASITYYSEQLFSTVGLSHDLSKILGATDLTFKLICCAIPFLTIERFGRRKLLIFAASGMSTCMVSDAYHPARKC
jgi:predicted membrane channel-forming protein YqfA (hemolysin III family)